MQKISLIALVFVLIACSAPSPVIPTAPVTLTVPSTSIPTSIPTLTETATPMPTETPAPTTKSDWMKMTPEQRMASVPVNTELGANPTFLGDNPVAFYFNQEGVLVDGVNGLTGEHMEQQQVFEDLLKLNGITKENSFRDDKNTLDFGYKARAFLGIPISKDNDAFQMREVTLEGVTYILIGKTYITRDIKDGRIVSIFVTKGVTDTNGKDLYMENYKEYNTQFGVVYEMGFFTGTTNQGMLTKPFTITERAAGYKGEPFDRMWAEEPYPDGYEWPADIAVQEGGIRDYDGVW